MDRPYNQARTGEWIEAFNSDAYALAAAVETWIQIVREQVEDEHAGFPDNELFNLTRILTTYCDVHGIQNPKCIEDAYLAIMSRRQTPVKVHGGGTILAFGTPHSMDSLQAITREALSFCSRIIYFASARSKTKEPPPPPPLPPTDSQWSTQKEAAALIGVSASQVSKLVRDGELESNGKKGKACRIAPQSIVKYRREKEMKERAGDGSWANGGG